MKNLSKTKKLFSHLATPFAAGVLLLASFGTFMIVGGLNLFFDQDSEKNLVSRQLQVLGEGQNQNPPNLPFGKGGVTDNLVSVKGDATDLSLLTEYQQTSPFLEGGPRGFLNSCRNCITGKNIADSAIDSSEIENKSITSSDIKSNQINSRLIENHSIQSIDLDPNQTFSKLTLDQLTIGQGSPSHFTLDTGDAYITDNLEVDGNVYLDQTLYVRDSSSISTMTSNTLQTTTANISNILSNSHLQIKGRLPNEDYFQINDFLKVFINPSQGTYIGANYTTIPTFSHIDGQNDLYIQDDLEVNGTIYGTISGDFSPSGNLDMDNNLILNIGHTNTDFTTGGGLNLAGNLNVNNQFFVNTTSGNIGIGTTTPATKFQISDTFQITATGIISQGTWNGSAITNTYLDSIAGSKVSGNISGLAANITGNLPFSQLTAPTANTALSMSNFTATLTFGNDTQSNNLFTLQDTTNNTGDGVLLNLATANPSLLNPLSVSASGLPALFVDYSAQVGIGTTTPEAGLDVFSSTTILGDFRFTEDTGINYIQSGNDRASESWQPLHFGKYSSTDTYLAISSTGNIGIGTTNPISILHVFSAVSPQIQISRDATTVLSIDLDASGNANFSTGGDKFLFNKKIQTDENFEQTCPEGYIWVEGSAKYGTLPGFCVMKYEAKCDDDADGQGDDTAEDGTYKTWHNDSSACTAAGNRAVVSSAEGAPIAYISQETARTYCQNLGEDYHLISENEWLTLADQISNLPINDTDNDAGLQLANSHSDNAPAYALKATASADPETSTCDVNQTMEHANNSYASTCQIQGDGSYGGDNDDQGFYGTGQSWSASGYSAGAANKSQNRVHVLKNKNTLWDLSGNVWEWTDALIMQTEQPTDGSEVGAGTGEWIEWNVSQKLQSAVSNSRPSLDDWSGSNGIGRLYTYGQDETSATMRAFERGGYWNNTSDSGVWALYLSLSPTNTYAYIGFRCAR